MSRSPFGWDLPPGVSTSDLPGNSQAEQEAEAFADAVYELLGEYAANDDVFAEKIIDWANKLRSDAYTDGYRQGIADEQMAQEHKEAQAYRIVCSNKLTE